MNACSFLLYAGPRLLYTIYFYNSCLIFLFSSSVEKIVWKCGASHIACHLSCTCVSVNFASESGGSRQDCD